MLLARIVSIAVLALSGCWLDRDRHVTACESDADCDTGFECYEGFCVAEEEASVEPGCAGGSQVESCYEGPAATMDVGACAGGQRICVGTTYSECLGQVVPGEEVCNGKDDDCDGAIDDVEAAAACDTRLQGACAEGTLRCRGGVELCQPTLESQAESCNAIDDDCDGATDEVPSAVCYPENTAGCAPDAQAIWRCTGLCATGVIACDGAAESCGGAITPLYEACPDVPFAEDEDCDGAIDEGCACPSGDTRPCYAGPVGTRGKGSCRAGTQECVDTEWGPCVDQVLPTAETCDNPDNDDDCNEVEDDVPGVGSACIASDETGECRNGTLRCMGEPEPECAAAEPSKERCDDIDQDCDDDPTNGFDLSSDEMCGACDVQCAPSEDCCGAVCVETAVLQDDADNCGACGRACGAGQYCCQGDCLNAAMPMMACNCTSACGDKSCCGNSCKDLETDEKNCGACGRMCLRDRTCVDGLCR